MLIDIYFSQSFFDHQMNYESWMDEHDEMMPLIKINGKHVPFSEQIAHGKNPILRQDDLELIATIYEEDIDIKIVSKYQYI